MYKYSLSFLFIFLLIMPTNAISQQENSEVLSNSEVQEIESSMADASAQEIPVKPEVKLQETIDDFNSNGKGKAFIARMDKGQLFYTTQTATVGVPADHHSWVDYRVMAYKEALVKAQAEYIKHLTIDNRTQLVRELMMDNQLPEVPVDKGSYVGILIEKLLALGEAVLDEKLEAFGIDPDQFKSAPLEVQKDLFRNSIEQRVITKAFGELTGMIPVKTFEANDDSGNYCVGVAAVASPKFRSRMKLILENDWNLPPNPKHVGGPTARDQAVLAKEALVQEFGIRRIFDDEGYPVLISYGQSGNSYRGDNPQMRMQYRQAAFSFAENEAYANFSLLLNSSGQFENKTAQKALVKEVAKLEVKSNSRSMKTEPIAELIKNLNESMSISGNINGMPGIYSMYRWTIDHPANGQEVNGVVLAWSPKSAQNAKNLARDPKPASIPAKQKKANTKQESGSRAGTDLMDASDF